VFHNATLAAIAEQRPSTVSALQKISGVGEGKAERYGEAVLGILEGADPSGRKGEDSTTDAKGG